MTTIRTLIMVAVAALLVPQATSAQTAAETAGIRQAALDYIEGYYAGDVQRMERALHPELAKRIVRRGQNGSRLDEMGARDLVEITRGRPRNGTLGRRDVRILDVFGNTATVRVDADAWVDYLHVARWNGEWKIVNVLWEMRP